jgi:hypothetical protein
MSTDLLDEIQSINAIYGDNTLSPLSEDSSSPLYSLTLPPQPEISLRFEFPPNYPDAPPSLLGTQSVGNDIPKGAGTHIVDIVRDILSEIYTPGAPCIFDVIEESNQKLSQLGLDSSGSKDEEPQTTSQTNGQDLTSQNEDEAETDNYQSGDLGEEPPWILSTPITEKKSIFIARAAAVTSVSQAQSYLAHLLATDKKVAKATHNITAWRIQGEGGVQYQDCDDDGETAAGGRLLHLLELMGVWDVMVVVTRWYGGVQLGPDRFRFINQCGRDAVVKGGFDQGKGKEEKEAGTKKEKRSEVNSSGRFRKM